MGRADIAVKNWLNDNERFADLFNGVVFGGRQVVRSEELESMDRETDIIVTDKEGKRKGVQRYRDIVKRWKKKMDLAVLACEAQNNVHYAMPVRGMTQDGLSYTEQIRILWRGREREKGGGKAGRLSGEEYLSRFGKNDRIFPVITLVFYYDVKKWDGAVDLYDMFKLDDELKEEEVLRKYIPNYRINLIDAGNVEHIERFRTDLQQVFGMLQCRGEKDKLEEYIQRHRDYFESVDVETYQAMREFLQSKKIMKDMSSLGKEEKINMCKAMEEWYADAIQKGTKAGMEAGRAEGLAKGIEEGRAEGREQGRVEGRAEGRAEGREQGRAEGRISVIIKMLSKGLSAEEIKSYTDGTDDEIEQAKKKLEEAQDGKISG